MRKISAVVFDMDGVLFDTEQMYLREWQRIGEKNGIEHVEETARKCIGLSVNDSVALLLATYGQDFPVEKYHQEINTAVNERIQREGIPVKKGTREILQYLSDRGFTVGLASSTKHDKVLDLLERAGLSGFFKVVIGGDMIAHSKPDPEIYRLACEKLGVEPSETAAVEDSRNGIISAKSAGMIPLLVPDIVSPTEEMLEAAECCFDDLFAVMEHIERNS